MVETTFEAALGNQKQEKVNLEYFNFENILTAPNLFSVEEFDTMVCLLTASHSLSARHIYFTLNLKKLIKRHPPIGKSGVVPQVHSEAHNFLNSEKATDRDKESFLKKNRKIISMISYNNIKRTLIRLEQKGFVSFDKKGKGIEWYINPSFRALWFKARQELLHRLSKNIGNFESLIKWRLHYLETDFPTTTEKEQKEFTEQIGKLVEAIKNNGILRAQIVFFLFDTPFYFFVNNGKGEVLLNG